MDSDDDIIPLGRRTQLDDEPDEDDDDDFGVALGPDERDADLLDGSWEQRYYAGRTRQRDWQGITVGLSLLVLLGLLVPTILVVTQ